MAQQSEEHFAAKLAAELAKNRELTRKLYTLRGEAPPVDYGSVPPKHPPEPSAALGIDNAPPLASRG